MLELFLPFDNATKMQTYISNFVYTPTQSVGASKNSC